MNLIGTECVLQWVMSEFCHLVSPAALELKEKFVVSDKNQRLKSSKIIHIIQTLLTCDSKTKNPVL